MSDIEVDARAPQRRPRRSGDDMFDSNEYSGHERIVFVADQAANLRAIIAIHNSALGPALGGCRFFRYSSASDAETDVLRLSRGMTMKAAVAFSE